MIAGSPIAGAPIAAAADTPEAAATAVVALQAFLARLSVYDPPTVAEVPVYASSHGYTCPADGAGIAQGISDHQDFPRGLHQPGSYGVRHLSGGQWQSAPSVSIGALVLANPDRVFDAVLNRDVRGRSIQVWTGPKATASGDPSFSGFLPKVKASGGKVTARGDRITVGLLPEKALDVEINAELYGGFGPCLRIAGAGHFAAECEMLRAATSSFSVRCRVRKVDTDVDSVFVSKKDSADVADAGFALFFGAGNGRLRFRVSDGTNHFTAFATTTDAGLVDSGMDWLDLIGVYDADADEMILYVGKVAAATTSTVGLGSMLTDKDFRIGSWGDGTVEATADLDEVAVWGKALTAAEVAARTGKTTPTADPGLLARYALDEATGTAAFTTAAAPLEVAHEGPAYIDTADVHDVDAASSVALEIVAAVQSGATQVLAGKMDAGGISGYRLIWANTAAEIRAVVDDGTDSAKAVWAGDAKVPHRYGLDLDRSTDVLTLYVDGVSVDTADASAVDDLSNAVNFRIGADGSAGAPLSARTLVSDVRLWTAARLAADHLADAWRRLSGTEADLAGYWKIDEGTGSSCADSAGSNTGTIVGTPAWHKLELAESGTTSWIGSGEGGAELAGKRKLAVYGYERRAVGALVDPIDLVWQVSRLPCESIKPWVDGYDGDWSPHTTPDVDDVWGTTPAAGRYTTSLARGLIRFASDPTGTMAFEVEGDNRGGYRNDAARIAEAVVTRDAALDPILVDSAQVGVVAAARPGVVGYQTGEGRETAAAVVSAVLKAVCGWWTWLRDGRWSPGLVSDPGTPGLVVAQVDTGSSTLADYRIKAPPAREDAGKIIRQVIARYRRYRVVPDEQDVPGAIRLTAAGSDASQEWRSVETEVDADAEARDGEVLTIDTAYDDAADARAEAARVLARRKVPRVSLAVEITEAALRATIGMTVTLQAPVYDLDAGRDFVVAGISEDDQGQAYKLDLEGPRDEPT